MTEPAPVLLLTFKRSETAARVFEAIRRARVPRLYVAADGPRPGITGEAEECAAVRSLVTAVDWPCELRTLFQPVNLGVKEGPTRGLDWFFAQEAEGIIFDDDCVPSPDFFPFAAAMLERYRGDPRVWSIGGTNYQHGRRRSAHSYYFSAYSCSWGWATWREVWFRSQRSATAWDNPAFARLMSRTFPDRPAAQTYWSMIHRACASGEITTSWDYPFLFSAFEKEMLSIMPEVNLISNFGFGHHGTNTLDADDPSAAMPLGQMAFPLDHPPDVRANVMADIFMERHHYRATPAANARRRLRGWLAQRSPRTYAQLRSLAWRLRSAHGLSVSG